MDCNLKKIICRLCLSETGQFRHIFTSVELDKPHQTMILSELICSFTDIKITSGDGLPEDICLPCTQEAVKLYKFKSLCEENEKFLRSQLKQVSGIRFDGFKSENELENDQINSEDSLESSVEDSKIKIEECTFDSESECDETDSEDHTSVNSGLFPCNLCMNVFVIEDDFEQHLQLHLHKIKDKLSCQECNRPIKNLMQFKEHVKIHDSYNKDKFSCPFCFMKYTKEGNLKKHIKEHKEKSNNDCNFVCNRCSKTFLNKEEFKMHYMNDHNDAMERNITKKRPFVCELCLKAFNTMCNLKEHLWIHNGQKIHSCSVCGKGFTRLTSLQKHEKVHRIVKTNSCNICNATFTSRSKLNLHKMKHKGQKPFACEDCGKEFAALSLLTIHHRVHTGERPYECNICDMKFQRQWVLTRHKRVHAK